MCESRDLRVPVGALSTLSLLWQVLAGSQGLFLLSLHIMGRRKAWDGSGWADIHSVGVLHGLKERHKPGLSLHCLNSSCGQVLLLQLSSLSPQRQPYSRQLEGRDGCGGEMALFPFCMSSAGLGFGCAFAALSCVVKNTILRISWSFLGKAGRRNPVCCLQELLILLAAVLNSPGKHLAASEWQNNI